mmetsp:Transcript_20301/g.38855  ORF Transcript_20301/g.38855 Transcript_20301/m.38855 type:complete len:241 (-) Transcript_20301:69-791(-)
MLATNKAAAPAAARYFNDTNIRVMISSSAATTEETTAPSTPTRNRIPTVCKTNMPTTKPPSADTCVPKGSSRYLESMVFSAPSFKSLKFLNSMSSSSFRVAASCKFTRAARLHVPTIFADFGVAAFRSLSAELASVLRLVRSQAFARQELNAWLPIRCSRSTRIDLMAFIVIRIGLLLAPLCVVQCKWQISSTVKASAHEDVLCPVRVCCSSTLLSAGLNEKTYLADLAGKLPTVFSPYG